MQCNVSRKRAAACGAPASRKHFDKYPRTGCARRPLCSRWRDINDDDRYDPLADDDEDYEGFRWEEIPDERQSPPPDEPWDEDDWD